MILLRSRDFVGLVVLAFIVGAFVALSGRLLVADLLERRRSAARAAIVSDAAFDELDEAWLDRWRIKP